MRKLNKLLVAGVAASMLAGTATSSFALPIGNHQAINEAAPAMTTNVRWHGGHWHGGHGYWRGGRYWGWGVGAAALGLGLAAASAPYYYGGPAYYGYDPYYGGCWRDRWGRVWCH